MIKSLCVVQASPLISDSFLTQLTNLQRLHVRLQGANAHHITNLQPRGRECSPAVDQRHQMICRVLTDLTLIGLDRCATPHLHSGMQDAAARGFLKAGDYFRSMNLAQRHFAVKRRLSGARDGVMHCKQVG